MTSAEIDVVCSVPRSHEGRVTNIIKFKRRDDGRWLMGPVTPRRSLTDRPYEQYLIDDELVDPGGRLDPAQREAARGRVSLRCDLCGLALDLRVEKLLPFLDRIADAGVSRCELAHLVRIVSSST